MADTWGENDKPVTKPAAAPSTEKWGEGDSIAEGKGFAGHARDTGLALAKGVVGIPEAAVGIGDILTGGRIGKSLENKGGSVGFRPKEIKQDLTDLQTPQSLEQMRQFDEAGGVLAKTGAALSNPSIIANTVVESVPAMLAGGFVGRGALAAGRGLGAVAAPTTAAQAARQAAIAGGVGEGAMMAGSQAEQIRQESEDGLLTGTQAGIAAATGVAGGAIGAAAGKLANRLGIGDVDTMVVQGNKGLAKQIADDATTAAVNPLLQQQARSIPTKVMLGAMTEGLLEELPQSVMEQVFQNIALGKEWHEDVDTAVVLGTLSGGAMGAGAAGYRAFREPGAGGEGAGAQAAPATPLQLGYQSDPLIVFPDGTTGRQADIDAYLNGLPEPERAAAQAKLMNLGPQAADGRAPESESARAVRRDILARLAQVRQEESGEPVVPQTAPPDGAAALAQQRALQVREAARVQAQRDAVTAANQAVETPDDEILQSTGAAQRPTPSQAMGLNPAAGQLSAAAALAVDTGAAGQVQQAAAMAQAVEAAQEAQKKGGKKSTPAAPAATGPDVDPETGEMAGMSNWTDAQLSNTFRGAQSREVRMQLAQELGRRRELKEQADLQAELDADLSAGDEPAASDSAFAQTAEDAGPVPKNIEIQAAAPVAATTPATDTKGTANVPQASQAQQAKAQQPQAGGTPSARSAAAPGLNNATATLNNGAQAAAPAGPQAQTPGETRDQRAQRVADAGAAWTRMPRAERAAVAQRIDVKPILQKNLHGAQWENLNADVQRKLAAALGVDLSQPIPKAQNAAEVLADRLAAAQGEAKQAFQQEIDRAQEDGKPTGPVGLRSLRAGAAARVSVLEQELANAREAVNAGALRKQLDGERAEVADLDARILGIPTDGAAAPAVTAAANEAATSDANDRPAPTAAQIEAGNYKKGHVRLNGHDIAIENPAGTKRRPEWPPLQNHYGYIKGSMGADKDHVDLFMTDRAEDASLPVFVVDQNNQDGTFDEHKVIMGAADEAEARSTYLGNYAKGWRGLGSITQMTQDEFKAWVSDPAKTKQRATPAQAETPAKAVKADQFAGNKVFTADAVAAARARMKSKLGRLNSGLDPELMMDGMTIAGAYIESGMRNFGQYAKAMVDDMGDGVKPYLLSFWEAARHFPGVETTGMTSVEDSAREHAALITPEVKDQAAEAVGTVAPPPAKRSKKTGKSGDMMLTQDWGVEHINGYGDSTREEGNETKDAFLKETRDYLRQVSLALQDVGFVAHVDMNGKSAKIVSVNESGMAGSGDVSLTMQHPDTGTNVYVTISDTSLRGVVPSTPSGIAVMYRAATGSDRYAAKGGNTWAPVNLSANDLAVLVSQRARATMEPPASTAASNQGNKNGNPEQTGRAADQGRAPEILGQRGNAAQPGSAPADPENLASRQPQDVPAPTDAGRAGGGRLRGATADVGGTSPADQGRDASDGRARTSGAQSPDAGTGKRSRVKAPEEVSPANPGPGNFHFENPLEIVGGGQVARFDKNRAAIELLNLTREGSRTATAEEQRTLAGYTGWGSFGQELFQGTWDKPMPKAGWEARDKWLREHLGEDEWKSAQRSITNAHYTDPPTVMAMWDMVKRMGFQGGRVLEPSMGIGNFFGMMPADIKGRSQLAGIELDRLTGAMAQQLYPDANVKIMGYQESKTPDDFYDVVIGNWPFENTTIADRRYNTLSPFLHDYFFLKALDQVRPGGLVVGITSNGTMDKKATRIRAALAKKAELVTSIRLPSGAFQEYAGTKVVTDIVILKKREQPLSLTPNEPWMNSVAYKTPAGPEVFINEFYVQNPGNVIGTTDFGHGTTRMQPGMIVNRPENMAERLREAVNLVPEGVFARVDRTQHISYITNHTADREGSLTEQGGKLFVVRGEHLAPAQDVVKYQIKSVPATAKREQQLRGLIDMRRKYAALIEAERDGSADDARAALREAYEAFTGEHGDLADSFGLDYLRRIDDPFYPAIAALTVNGQPSAILRESTMRRGATLENPSVSDAYVLARNLSVQPTLEEIAALAKKPAEQIKAELVKTGAVFEAPNGDVVPSDIYLSGNVRQKLREAQAALEDGNAGMARNVAELKKVVPEDVPYFNIESQLGATWVPAKAYADYVAHMLNRSADGIEATFINGRWKIQLPDGTNNATEARTGFGTGHYPFTKLVNAAFTNQTVKIRRKDSDGTEYVDIEATDEANARIGDIRTKFGEWLWSDPERRAGLEAEYNEARNAYATPKYDGSFLRMEGMALSLGRGPFNLREHQVNAIWRALVNRRSINAHEVGTGKTFTMGGIAVESRRYGIAKKPMLLAHNANSASVAAEIQMMYPGAKALYIDNLSPDTIAVKMRQIANDDWDVVVMPHSLIDRLSFREETLMVMAQDDIKALEEEAYAAAEDDGVTLDADMLNDEEELKKLRSVTAKELVKARNRIIETIKKQAMQSSKEGAIPFEDLGIDMVLVDEVHEFKKPPISTRMNMKGLNTQTSNRSIALQFITRYIRANNFGGNVHTFTGTPITNTMTEIFHQMRYVMEDEMKAAGVDSWDGWFGSFAKEVQDVELSAAGEYETITRLAGFINVPELRRMIGQYMDVVFADDMPEMQPRQVNGKTLTAANLTEAERAELLNGRTEGAADRPYKKVINVTSDLTSEQSRIFARLQGYARAWRSMGGKARMEAMRSGAPESPIITEGMANKASFDVRLTEDERWAGMEGQAPDDPGSKASKLVANVAEIYKSDPSAAQVVFSDVGYSTSQKRSAGRNAAGDKVYRSVKTFSTVRDIVERLVQQGIPREQIAVVDGSTSKEKRKEIANAMNTLAVRVVIGSTDTLGVGVNMQRNLRAMHHLDAPYMPGELEQRNGRGLRQGNQWNTVLEYRYMTDRLDGRRWQILAIKQRFITAFMKSNSDSRVIEGDAASDEESDILQSFSEAAGDPRILIRAKLQKNVEALRRAERMHGNGVADARRTLRGTREAIEWNRGKLKEMTANNLLQRLSGMMTAQSDDFRMTVRGTLYDARADAGDAIDQFLTTEMRMEQSGIEVGQYRDQTITARWPSLSSQPDLVMEVDGQEFSSGSLRGLEQQIRNYPQRVEKVQANVDQREASIERLEQVSKSPFARAKDLDAAVKRLDALEKDIEGNPVPPPAWLRAGAPVDSLAFRKGAEIVVTGHRWTKDGWFVLAQDDKGEMAVPYTQVQDAQGMPLYEERELQAPVVIEKEAKGVQVQAGQPVPATSAVEASTDVTTDTPAFRRWFGDSKVVDAAGQPQRVYHGTTENFTAFSEDFIGDGNGNADWGTGFYFADTPDAANTYAEGDGGNVMPVYLALQNPAPMSVVQTAMEQPGAEMDVDYLRDELSGQGYDGIIVEHPGQGREMVVFRPDQIKSAIGNSGAYDGGNPDIRFSRSTPQGKPAALSREMTPELARALMNIRRPATKESVRAAVRELVNGLGLLPNRLGRIVVATADEIKRDWEPLIGATGIEASGRAGQAQGFYSPSTRTVFLIADHIYAGDELGVVAHELMHKHGPSLLGKDGWNHLHSAIESWARAPKGSMERTVYDEAAQRVEASGPELSNQELFPYAVQVALELGVRPNLKAQTGTVARWLAQVKEVLQQVMAKIVGRRGDFSSQDLVNLAFGIAQRENPAHRDEMDSAGLTPDGAFDFANDDPRHSRSAMKSVDANIARGRAALARALTEKNTVHRAMFRTGMGWVDFVWGAEGVVKPNGRTKGAMGLSHILEARQRKDGLNEQQTVQLLGRMVDVIAVGKEVRRVEFAGLETVTLEHANVQAILTKRPGSNAWMVSGWELMDSGASGAGYVAPAATVNAPTTAQRTKISESGVSIANDGGSGNLMFSRSKLADIKDKALEQIHQTLSHPGTVSLWDKSIGTMRNLAERVPAFKPVFEAAQQFIDDVSTLANEAADAAPRLLPRVDSWKDLKKQPISAADNKAVAAPIFEGTLMWTRDVDGTAALVDGLAKKYANLSADEKGQMLLRAGRLNDGVLKMWRGLPVSMYESNINARFESQMLKAGVVWTDSELKSIFKANDHQISLYREARAGIDRSIDITTRADMLRALGEDYAGLRDLVMDQTTLEDAMKVITDVLQADNRARPNGDSRIADLNNLIVTRYEQSKKLMDEGYAPLSRFGRYTVDVVDAAGERQYFGMYETKREANQAVLQMKAEFKGAKVEQGTMSDQAFKMFQGITPESLQQFANILNAGGENDAAQDKVFQEYLKLAKNNHSALKRLIHRKGIAGYSEDIGRVLASFVYSNARLAAGGLNAGTLEKAVQDIPKEQGELRDVAMGLRNYIQDPQEEGQAVRGMLFAQYLGGSAASAMVNMTQPFAVTLPWLSQYGGIKKAGTQMARALKDMGTRGFQYEKDLALALRAAEDDGTVSPQEVHQLMAQARGAGGMRSGDGTRKGDALAQAGNLWEKTKVAWGQPFALAEQFNRRTTFIASYRIAKDQGMNNPGEFARQAVLETQFLYSKANKMRWARGAVGGTLMTFKTYSVSYLELMHRMWSQGGPEGKRAVGWSMAMLMLMGGAGGLPFMEDAEDLIDGAGQLMGYNLSTKQWRKQLLRDVLGKELAEFMDSGLSGLPGAPIDVSGRLGMGDLIPGTGLFLSKQSRERDLMEIAGPAGDLVSRGFAGARKLLTGDVAGAAVEVSPTAVRNALKGGDMAVSGMYKDTKGYKVIDTTLPEAAAKFLGFQPRSVAEVQEANSFMQRSKSFYSQSSAEIKAQWADALFRKDDAALERVRERLAAWNRSNPDQPIVVKMPDVWKKVREMGKDRTERIADTSPKALRAQMREAAREVSR